MKTIHASTNMAASSVGATITGALRDNNINGGYRIIKCGAGLVLLPDTDRSEDATEGEVIKALGFRDKAAPMPAEGERTTFVVNRQGESTALISLTAAQVRFLKWCDLRIFSGTRWSFPSRIIQSLKSKRGICPFFIFWLDLDVLRLINVLTFPLLTAIIKTLKERKNH